MQIGIIGIGSVTLNFAQRAAKSGHQVLISSTRDNGPLREIVSQMGSNAKLVSTTQAATADIIILFSPWEELEILLKNLPNMAGKIIMHTNYPIFNLNSFISEQKLNLSCEIIASILPTAEIVKIYNILGSLEDCSSYRQPKERTEIFFSGKNKIAKNNVKAFLESLNYSGIDIITTQNTSTCM